MSIFHLTQVYSYFFSQKKRYMVDLSKELTNFQSYILLLNAKQQYYLDLNIAIDQTVLEQNVIFPNVLYFITNAILLNVLLKDQTTCKIKLYESVNNIVINSESDGICFSKENFPIDLSNIQERYLSNFNRDLNIEYLDNSINVYIPMVSKGIV